jgi:hypothetical protein
LAKDWIFLVLLVILEIWETLGRFADRWGTNADSEQAGERRKVFQSQARKQDTVARQTGKQE